MSTYQRYQEARDTAWRALLRLEEKRRPTDVDALCRQLGVEIHPFPAAEEKALSRCVRQAGGGVCVSLRIRGQWHVFLRLDRLDESQRRFAVAHELGHLLLSHETRSLAPGVRAFESRENQGDLMDDPQDLDDYAADIFAIRLLAPACVLHELHVDQSGRIMALCGMPPRAAALRAERMTLLNERDVFYNHPLERQVRDQFLPFIQSRRTEGARLASSSADTARNRLLSSLPRPTAADPALPASSAVGQPSAAPRADQPSPSAVRSVSDAARPPSAAPDNVPPAQSAAPPPENERGEEEIKPRPPVQGRWLIAVPLAAALGLLIYFLFQMGK